MKKKSMKRKVVSAVALILIAATIATLIAVPVSAKGLSKNGIQRVDQHLSDRNQTLWYSLLPKTSGDIVYEFTNGSTNVFTMLKDEIASLRDAGWEEIGPVFYSVNTGKGWTVYRHHNDAMSFIYSLSKHEKGYTLDGPAFFVEQPVVSLL